MCHWRNIKMTETTVLVTGSDGFIGSHVCKAFKNISWNVVGLDRTSNNSNAQAYCNELLRADYGDKTLVTKYLEQVKPNVIVHCAGTSLVGPSVTDPASYYQNNVQGTISLLESILQVQKEKLPTFIFSSSASVYGNPVQEHIVEDHPINPMSPYGNTKAIIEKMLQDYATGYGLNSVVFRFFNASGASEDLGQPFGATHIIARILEAKLNNKTFTLNGTDYQTKDGTCIRDYVHVEDIAQAHLKVVTTYTPQGACVFNLGTNNGFSNQEIINYVTNSIGEVNVEHGPRREGDPDQLIADSTKARELLHWDPSNSNIESIIDSVWNWYVLLLEKQKEVTQV
jgi:UDP-glucose-4-epimerase GalE